MWGVLQWGKLEGTCAEGGLSEITYGLDQTTEQELHTLSVQSAER
jgi:hypothetical protein